MPEYTLLIQSTKNPDVPAFSQSFLASEDREARERARKTCRSLGLIAYSYDSAHLFLNSFGGDQKIAVYSIGVVIDVEESPTPKS